MSKAWPKFLSSRQKLDLVEWSESIDSVITGLAASLVPIRSDRLTSGIASSSESLT